MKIKVAESNREKLQAAIDEAQKKAQVRWIDADDIFDAIETAEEQLTRILAKKDWPGAAVFVDKHAQKFPACYRGTPESTQFRIERNTAGWNVTWIGRNCVCGSTTKFDMRLTDDQKSKIAEFVTQ